MALEIQLDPTPKPKREGAPVAPLILDVRGDFDFTLSHYIDSQPIRWNDFAQVEMPFKGLLDPDSKINVRKLRALGVYPEREIIIVGKGAKGWGEEGRVAWMLQYYGINNVKIVPFEKLGSKKTTGKWLGSQGEIPVWLPKINESIRALKKEVLETVKNKGHVIDVRAKEEFLGQKTVGEARSGHIKGAINIPWTNFIDSNGFMKQAEAVKKILNENGIKEGAPVVFYCTGGVRSGYVTVAALKAGFSAKNYDGSFWEWAADNEMPVEKNN